MITSSLQEDLLFVCHSLLQTGQSVSLDSEIIQTGVPINGRPFFSLMSPGSDLLLILGILLYGTPLRVFGRGTMTSVRYRDVVLEPYIFKGVQLAPILFQCTTTHGHIEHIWWTIFWKIYAEWTSKPDLQTSALQSMKPKINKKPFVQN